MQIEQPLVPAPEDIVFLGDMLNQDASEFGVISPPFAFFIRDDESKIIAGCNGYIVLGVIYTDQLWVHSGYRKQGFGGKLMDKVHDYGRRAGCKMATVSTMSFQARPFYEKLGYVVDFERPGYAKDSSCIFLSKRL